MAVSRIVQVLKVCVTVSLRYSLTSQNPPSLTCERTKDPAPNARTRSSRFSAGFEALMGANRPAPVVMATVAEPVAIRMKAAINQASSNEECLKRSPVWPCHSNAAIDQNSLKPPPGTTRGGPRQRGRASSDNSHLVLLKPWCRAATQRKSTPISIAMMGFPNQSAIKRSVLEVGSQKSAILRVPRITGARIVRSATVRLGSASWVLSSPTTGFSAAPLAL